MPNNPTNTQYKTWQWHSDTKYYNLVFDQDLFGQWTVTKYWGGKFTKTHRYKKEYCAPHNIDKLVAQIHKRRISRGYQLAH